MKEFLATGVVVAGLSLFGSQTVGPVGATDDPPMIHHDVSEGFVPHQRVTMPPPVRATAPTDGLLPDYGSEAYL